MKKAILLAVALVITWLSVADAQVWVRPYTRKDGTHVEGHYRSRPDSNPYNNYSFPGNTNPYTGREATGDPNRYLENYRNRSDSNSGGYNPYSPYRR
jgi:hypothetical protein